MELYMLVLNPRHNIISTSFFFVHKSHDILTFLCSMYFSYTHDLLYYTFAVVINISAHYVATNAFCK